MERNSRNSRVNRGRRILLAALVCVLAALAYFFPPIQIVSLRSAKETKEIRRFDPKEFVERLWTERLFKASDQAIDAGLLLSAIKNDKLAARQQYGRQVGLGSTYYYFLKGKGRVVAVKPEAISLAISDSGAKTDLILAVANISGNAVRDATGLVSVDDFPNSQEFNQIAAELNRRIETGVLAGLSQKLRVGTTIEFVGCAEMSDHGDDLQPLRLIPISVKAL